jgi:hypothetical protein
VLTFPTAASPSRTSLTLLLGFGVFESAMLVGEGGLLARKLRPSPYSDTLADVLMISMCHRRGESRRAPLYSD